MNYGAQIQYNIYKSERDWVQKSYCAVVHIFTVQVVILFNRQLIKLWKGAQTPLEKLEKVFFLSLSLKVHCERKEGML
jgi:hypothetical protein